MLLLYLLLSDLFLVYQIDKIIGLILKRLKVFLKLIQFKLSLVFELLQNFVLFETKLLDSFLNHFDILMDLPINLLLLIKIHNNPLKLGLKLDKSLLIFSNLIFQLIVNLAGFNDLLFETLIIFLIFNTQLLNLLI